MPRTNKNRATGAEERLALRMAAERRARGWTYEKMAEMMTAAGCEVDRSAIYRMEKGNPRRRITVDEAATMSAIWAIPIDMLLADPQK